MRTKQIITKVLVVIAGLVVLFASIQAQAAGTLKIKGLIVSRDGDNMLLSSDRGKVTATITQDTKVKLIKGVLGIRYETMGMAALIPGLRVQVDAEFSNNQYTAKTIKFRGDDLKTAMAIQAGMEMTQQQVQANKEGVAKGQAEDEAIKKRFSELKDYDVKGTLTINYPVNSAKLSDQSKEDLRALSASAMQLQGYLIQVAGYTDSSGSANYNTELSDRRAQNVVTYLRQSCGVPISRVLSPAAMGMSRPAAPNETEQGKAENRRVEVKILVNRGLAQ